MLAIGKVVTVVSIFFLFVGCTCLIFLQAKSRNPHLEGYEHNWAILEIMRTVLKHKRSYRRRTGRCTNQTEEPANNGDKSDDEDDFSNSDNEEGTSSSGKRTKEKQQGPNAKRARI
jgi:hypothetical protein